MEPTLPCRFLVQFSNPKMTTQADCSEKLSDKCLYFLRTAFGATAKVSNGLISKTQSVALRFFAALLALTIGIPLLLIGAVLWTCSGSHAAKYHYVKELKALPKLLRERSIGISSGSHVKAHLHKSGSSSRLAQSSPQFPPSLTMASSSANNKQHPVTSTTPKSGRTSPAVLAAVPPFQLSAQATAKPEIHKVRSTSIATHAGATTDQIELDSVELPKQMLEILQQLSAGTFAEGVAKEQLVEIILQVPSRTDLEIFLTNLNARIPANFENYRRIFEAVAMAAARTPNQFHFMDTALRIQNLEKELVSMVAPTVPVNASSSAPQPAPEQLIASQMQTLREHLNKYYNEKDGKGLVAHGVHSIGIQFMRKILERADADKIAQMAFAAFLPLYQECRDHQVCWPKGLSCLGEVSGHIKSLHILGSAIDAALTAAIPLESPKTTNAAVDLLLDPHEAIDSEQCFDIELQSSLIDSMRKTRYKPAEFLNSRYVAIEALVAEYLEPIGLSRNQSRNTHNLTPLILVMQYYLSITINPQPPLVVGESDGGDDAGEADGADSHDDDDEARDMPQPLNRQPPQQPLVAAQPNLT